MEEELQRSDPRRVRSGKSESELGFGEGSQLGGSGQSKHPPQRLVTNLIRRHSEMEKRTISLFLERGGIESGFSSVQVRANS